MIHSLSANHKSFHAVEFTSGLNVVMAERSKKSTKKDTRNGVGKSTLIQIIDFCLGSRAVKGKKLIIDDLQDWTFTLEITLFSRRVKATRAISEHGKIIIEGDTTGWPEQPRLDKKKGEAFFVRMARTSWQSIF